MNKVLFSSVLLCYVFFTALLVNGKTSPGNNGKSSVSEESVEDQLSILWDMSDSFSPDEPDSSLFYMRRLQTIASLNNKPKWLASAYGAIADIQYEQGYVGEAVYNYLEAAKIFKQIGELDRMANVYNSIGDVYVLAKEFSVAAHYFSQAKDIFFYSKNNKKMAMVCRNLAICYKEQKNFDEAEVVLELGKNAASAAKDSLMLGVIYNTLGAVHFNQFAYDSARSNYQRAINCVRSLPGGLRVKAFATNNIGEAYLYEGKFEQAERWLENAIVLKKELGESSFIQSTINLLGQLYIRQDQYERAISVLEEGLQDDELLPVDDELGKGLALMVEALVKANAKGEPSDRAYLNQKFALYSQKLIAYNTQLQALREELETIGKQQVVRLAVEKHSMNTKLGAAEEKNEKFKYAIIIPVFLLICAIISVYLSLRRNARYRKLYAGIEEVLGNRALRKPGDK